MKRYNNTTSSMKDQKLPLSRRHFVAASGIAPFALGAMASIAMPTIAQADVMDILENDNVLGDPKAPISIVEYASLTCPHCAEFHNNALQDIKTNYIDTGKAHLIFRDFPLDRWAFQASVLAHSAGKEKFFTVLEILFKKQAEWTNGSDLTAEIIKIGNMVGISKAKFEASLADEALGESILTDRMVGANEYKVASTPTLFINGERYEGSRKYEEMDAYLKGL